MTSDSHLPLWASSPGKGELRGWGAGAQQMQGLGQQRSDPDRPGCRSGWWVPVPMVLGLLSPVPPLSRWMIQQGLQGTVAKTEKRVSGKELGTMGCSS